PSSVQPSACAMELPLRQPEISKRLQDTGVASAIGDDDTAIGTQLAAMMEVQGPPHDVGHGSSGLLDDQGSGGVIPYLLAVISPGRHAEIDFRLAPRNDPVLGLAVHPDGWRDDPQPRRDRSGVSMRAVAGLYRLAKAENRGIGSLANLHWQEFRFVFLLLFQRHNNRPMPLHGREDHAPTRGGRSRVDRQVGARQGRDDDLAFDDERQSHGVLLVAEKAFGSIDRIDCPESVAILAASPPVDPAADLGRRGVAICIKPECSHLTDHLVKDGRVPRSSEFRRVLLGDDGIVRKRDLQRPADDGLAAKVCHRHRALVPLVQDLRLQGRPHRETQPRRLADSLDGLGLLTLVLPAHVPSGPTRSLDVSHSKGWKPRPLPMSASIIRARGPTSAVRTDFGSLAWICQRELAARCFRLWESCLDHCRSSQQNWKQRLDGRKLKIVSLGEPAMDSHQVRQLEEQVAWAITEVLKSHFPGHRESPRITHLMAKVASSRNRDGWVRGVRD